MKIGILGHGLIGWNGGIDFIRTIVDCLNTADNKIELHLLIPLNGPLIKTKQKLRTIKHFAYKIWGKKLEISPQPDIEHITSLIESINSNIKVHIIDIGIGSINKCAKKNNIDIVMPAIRPLYGCIKPWLGYIPDYQHVYYPHFFSSNEIENRNKLFAKMLDIATHVIVNSKAVEDDIKKYNPGHKSKIITLPFSASPHLTWLQDCHTNFDKFGIENQYFMISNQFWQHKDHLTAWSAFSIILKKFPELDLVCTGPQHDYRNPDYFSELMNNAKKLGIERRVKCLGLIPKNDQISLMKNAIAVIQPSLFEGGPGGGAIYDAISLGITSIISDIKVNLELKNEENVIFFKTGNAQSLSEKMQYVLENEGKFSKKSTSQLIESGIIRRKMCGAVLLKNIESIQKH